MIVILSACSVEKQSGENNEANSTIQTSETVTVTRGTLTPTVSAQTTIIQASDFVLSSTEKGVFETCVTSGDTDVKIGQNATVVITAGTKENILLLPLSVIAGRQGKGMVTVIKDGEQIQTEVTLGATDGAYIEILSGVEEGDVVSSVPPNLDPRSNS